MKNTQILLAFCAVLILFTSGCTGINLWQPIQQKPYTYLKGDQLGRDQIANRTLVAYTKKLVLHGKDSNEVLTLLGQPQQVQIIQRDILEDWHFIYYKRYAAYVEKLPYPGKYTKGEFVVRFHNNKVTDVVTLN